MTNKNIITAKITFSFKGKTFTPTSKIDLDLHMHSTGHVPDLYLILARDNDIGLYSYEYEMLQAEPVQIESAEGLVADFVTDGQLNIDAFEPAWRDQATLDKVTQLLKKHKLECLLQNHPELEKVLLEVYQAGKQDQTD